MAKKIELTAAELTAVEESDAKAAAESTVAGPSFFGDVHPEDAAKAETRLQAIKRRKSAKLEMADKWKDMAAAELAAAEISVAELKTEGAVAEDAEDAEAEVFGEHGLKTQWLPAMNIQGGLSDKNYTKLCPFLFYFASLGCCAVKAAGGFERGITDTT